MTTPTTGPLTADLAFLLADMERNHLKNDPTYPIKRVVVVSNPANEWEVECYNENDVLTLTYK